MVPPFLLHARGIGTEVEVAAPFALGSTGSRARHHLPAEAELVDAAVPTVGAVQEEGHSVYGSADSKLLTKDVVQSDLIGSSLIETEFPIAGALDASDTLLICAV